MTEAGGTKSEYAAKCRTLHPAAHSHPLHGMGAATLWDVPVHSTAVGIYGRNDVFVPI